MPALSLAPALSLLATFGRISPARPLHTLIRTTGYRLRPPRPLPHLPRIRAAQDAVLGSGAAGPHQMATLLCERRNGSIPTIVLGGFVPDATEQVFLLRGALLRRGGVYYLNYPRNGFSADLLFAQLDDLVEELARLHATPPVVLSVSFGAGLVFEWLRRARLAGRRPALRGLVFVSPMGCVGDLLFPGESKPATLLGRTLKPYLDSPGVEADARQVEKSRTVFSRMFEAGAQNKAALATLMTAGELRRLHAAVMETIARVDARGASERIRALVTFPSLIASFSPALLPLSDVPALVLFAENEDAVLDRRSPTRFALGSACAAYFPKGACRTVSNPGGAPVQHASLIFHFFNFLPHISRFYREVKTHRLLQAA
ncbi:alpha/beta hydrolase [Termitidicoccus mucosus]|uniref:AB hydrolase-1 domain-containing protein n=1 Tax=Termitidicoccus mucosus TaxID=1184151 RepID=A0A178IJP4_9BACT|nr:hypothetical protein AW736_10050 [Opitutaceae bacterium TSB47]